MLGRVYGFALHHYTENLSFGDPAKNDWNERKGSAIEFSPREWYEILKEADRMDGADHEPLDVMGEFDRAAPRQAVRRRVGHVVQGRHRGPCPNHLLGQQNTMRDALVAGLTFDTFHRHADKVAMANIAQLVNCLQSLFLADGDKFVTTPTYHVFDLYGAARRRPVGADAWSRRRPSATSASTTRARSVGAQRLGQREGQDADAHGHQPARERGRRRSRSRCAARRNGPVKAAQISRARHPRPQHVRAARTWS